MMITIPQPQQPHARKNNYKMKRIRTANYISLVALMFMFCMSCKAQNVLPLNTSIMDIPNGAYVKDTNNELNQFIGIYKANHNGNEITLYVTKQNDKQIKSGIITFYRDALIIKFTVKNSSGQLLQDTQNFASLDNDFYSMKIKNANTVSFAYEGTTCRVGQGLVYLKKLNAIQLSWDYLPQEGYNKNCPPGSNTTVYLPLALGLIFTKQ